MLILHPDELARGIPSNDRRAVHIRRILSKGPGDELKAGILSGPIGVATIVSDSDGSMRFSFRKDGESAPPFAVDLVLGAPRPIQANRLLKELCSLGIRRILFCGSELGEKSYLESDLYRGKDFRAALMEGAEQSGNTHVPETSVDWTLARALERLREPGKGPDAIALDPRRAKGPIGSWRPSRPGASIALAIGSERGWTDRELELLDSEGFSRYSLGDRVLKTETAATVAVAAVLALSGLM